MFHLPKKRPWIILLVIYVVIIAVWIGFYYLAKDTGTQSVSPEEAEELLEKSLHQKKSNPPAEKSDAQ